MSHNVTVQTKLDNLGNIEKALRELGVSYQKGDNLRTHSRWGGAPGVKADITFKNNHGDTVGFAKQRDGTYAAVGDFYGGIKVKHPNGVKESLSQMNFTKRMTQMSAVVKVKDAIRKRYGLKRVRYDIQTDGKIRLRLYPRNVR